MTEHEQWQSSGTQLYQSRNFFVLLGLRDSLAISLWLEGHQGDITIFFSLIPTDQAFESLLPKCVVTRGCRLLCETLTCLCMPCHFLCLQHASSQLGWRCNVCRREQSSTFFLCDFFHLPSLLFLTSSPSKVESIFGRRRGPSDSAQHPVCLLLVFGVRRPLRQLFGCQVLLLTWAWRFLLCTLRWAHSGACYHWHAGGPWKLCQKSLFWWRHQGHGSTVCKLCSFHEVVTEQKHSSSVSQSMSLSQWDYTIVTLSSIRS